MTEIIKEKLKTIKGFGTITKLEITNLITTIESQKEEIKKLLFIQKLWKEVNPPVYQMFELIAVAESKVESLKAITELKNEMLQDTEKRILVAIEARDKLQDIKEAAIKGLNEISEYPKGNDLVYVRDIKDKADNTIFEIERLSNAQA